MRDIPLLLLATTVSAHWFSVGVMIVRVKRKARRSVGIVPQQRIERLMWLVWVPLVVAWIALPWIALQRTDPPWGMPSIDSPLYAALRWVAAFVGIGCLAFTVRSWIRMGKDWRMDVSLDSKTVLITDGPFRRIRHPIYAFSILLMVCTGIVLPTWPMLAVAAIQIALYNAKARNEERHLLKSHGEAYARYVERTGRFIPRFGAHRTQGS
jgi:protein-S-isoprenylcysteine O-methyltransferase Ste14